MLGPYFSRACRSIKVDGDDFIRVPKLAAYALGHAAAQTVMQTDEIWEEYLEANPDLHLHFRGDLPAARAHWCESGFMEARPLFLPGTRADAFLLTNPAEKTILEETRTITSKHVLLHPHDDVSLMRRVLNKNTDFWLMPLKDYERLLAVAPFTIYVEDKFYFSKYPHVAKAVEKGNLVSARQHFIHEGWARGLQPFAIRCDLVTYRKYNADIATMSDHGLLEHFQDYAAVEGRLNFFGTSPSCVTWRDNPISRYYSGTLKPDFFYPRPVSPDLPVRERAISQSA